MPVNALCEVYIFFRFCGLVLFCLSLPLTVIANPQGADVVHGQVDFDRPNAHTLNITNSPSAIVNWQSFSIDKGERTHFIQQTATSAILNRVTGQDPSAILGNLSSNGRVFLINPNGMVFGPDAVIDTAGFIGSTLNLTDDDFLAGKLNFEGGSEAGRIENHGLIQAKDDGGIYLIAPSIENSGLIHTDGGSLLLAAGRKITISSLDLDHISVEIQAPEDEVLNLGTMLSSGGAMGFFAGTIRNHGHVEANSMTVDEAGTIKLVAKADIHLEADSQIQASGSQGGDIHIESKTGTTWVAGDVEATGSDNTGGQINILGERVGVIGDANIDASGETGGGSVLVGGDYKGEGDVKNAQVTYVGKEVTIAADAVTEGDGGKVIVWADDTTRYYGNTSVRGGGDSGNGGFVEVSGKESLDFEGTADVSATAGDSGTLLLDPATLRIIDESDGGDHDDNLTEDSRVLSNDDDIGENTLSWGAINRLGEDANIIIEATGDITIDDVQPTIGIPPNDDVPSPIDSGVVELDLTTGSLTIRSTAGGINFASFRDDVIRTEGGAITFEALGGEISGSGGFNTTGASGDRFGDVTLRGAGAEDLDFWFVRTGGGNIDIRSTSGIGVDFTVRDADIDSSSNNGDGGTINITAGGEIFFDNVFLDSSSEAGNGGAITLSTNDTIQGQASFDSSSAIGDGGVISLVSGGDIDIGGNSGGGGSVFNSSSPNGRAGGVQITATGNINLGGFDTGSVINTLSSVSDSGEIVLIGNEIDFNGNITTNSGTILQPSTPGQNIEISGAGDTNTLDITSDEIALIDSAVTIGHPQGTGTITVSGNGASFDNEAILQSPGLGGRIVISGPVATNGNDLSLVAGGAVTVNNSLSTEGGAIGIESTGSGITLTDGASIDATITPPIIVEIAASDSSSLVKNLNIAADEPGSIILRAADTIFMSATSSIESDDGSITLASTAGEISLGTVSSDTGQITITAGGGGIDETGNDTTTNIGTQGTAVLTANGAIGDTATNGELDTDVATLRIPSANGPVNIVENDNIQLGDGTGGISSSGAIAIESTGGQISLGNTISTTGDGGITLETIPASTDNTNITLRDNGISAANGVVTISAGGNIVDGDGNDDEPEITTTSQVTLTANGGQGAIGAENAVINIFGTNDVNTNGNPIFVSTEVPSAPPEEPPPGELVSEKEGGLRAFTPERPSDVSGLKEAKPWTDNIDEKTASTQWLETGPRIDFETMSSDFSVNALLNDEWILLVDYKLEKPGDVNLTISGEGVSPTKIKLDGSTTKRQVAVVVLSMLHDRLSSNTRHTIMGDFWANLNLTAVEVNNPKVPVQMNLYNLSAGPKDNLLPPLSDTRTLPTPGAPKLHPIEADVDPRPPSMVDEPGTPTASKMPDEPGDDKRVKLTCYGPCGEIEDRLAARSSRNLDEIKFGPPSLIRPTAGEQARYSFYSRSDFDIVDVYFLRVKQEAPGIETELTVNSQRLPAGIAKGEWVGKDEQRSWNGMMSKNEPSLGQHGLRVKAYDQTEGWHVGNADSRVTVVE